jgi:membrane-bound lytic murein transglycosylase MltF
MNTLKRLVAAAVTVLLAAAPAAYALEASDADADARATMLGRWTGDFDGMKERRLVRILVVLSRTHYNIDRGRQYGLTYEAGLEFEKFIAQKLPAGAPRVTVVFVPVARERILDALIAGDGDIAAANLTITPERLERVDFSAPFTTSVRELPVTAKSAAPIASAEALSGQHVYVRKSSSYFESLALLNEKLRAAGKAPVAVTPLDEHLEDEDVLEMVSAGLVPATVVDDHVAKFWTSVLDNLQVHDAAAVRTGGEIGWAIRKNAPQLKALVDEFAVANKKGTYLTNVLLVKYLRDNKWVKNAAAEADMARFQATVDFFRKYGDQYDLPWLLVAAQAYQESGIDQSKRSPVGAVGVMQIKPSTAEGSPIFIKGVDADMERNIEAGAKYLRFIVDQYYADESMDRLDKGLFAIASYNAGPARIAGLRREAAKMGLDPNRWFGNVEVVAAKRIGRETVTYVSNIYKYYVTYQLAVAEAEAKRKGGVSAGAKEQ